MTDTAIAAAFAKAGKKGPNARLKDLAIEAIDYALGGIEPDEPADDGEALTRAKELAKMAIKLEPGNMRAAQGLFLDALMREEGRVLNALLDGAVVGRKAGEFLHKVWDEEFGDKGVNVRKHERSKPGTKAGGQFDDETQWKGAARDGGGSQLKSETHRGTAATATSPERIAAAKVAMGIVAQSWLDREKIRGRPIGDILYGEMERSARVSLNDGIEQIRQAAMQQFVFRSVPYNPALRDTPARQWADEKTYTQFEERWKQLVDLGLQIPKIAELFGLEHENA